MNEVCNEKYPEKSTVSLLPIIDLKFKPFGSLMYILTIVIHHRPVHISECPNICGNLLSSVLVKGNWGCVMCRQNHWKWVLSWGGFNSRWTSAEVLITWWDTRDKLCCELYLGKPCQQGRIYLFVGPRPNSSAGPQIFTGWRLLQAYTWPILFLQGTLWLWIFYKIKHSVCTWYKFIR